MEISDEALLRELAYSEQRQQKAVGSDTPLVQGSDEHQTRADKARRWVTCCIDC
jgi:hypothetical protein